MAPESSTPRPPALPDPRLLAILQTQPGYNAIRALLALTHPDRAARQPAIDAIGEIDWTRIPGLARRHRVVVQLAAGLRRMRLAGLPADTRETLKAAADQRVRRSLATLDRLRAMLTDLQTAGIPVATFKGIGLSLSLYDDPCRRDPGDIDLIVPAERIHDACAVLARHGVNARTLDRPLLDNPRQRRRLLRVGSALTMESDRGTGVDLHWRWSRNPHLPRLDPARVWSVAGVSLGQESIPVPDPVEHLVYLAVHGLHHGWSHLKWVTDLRQVLHDPAWIGGDWQALMDRARALGAARAVAASLQLAAWVDGTPLPAPVAACLAGDRRTAEFARAVADRFAAGFTDPSPELANPSIGQMLKEFRGEWLIGESAAARWNGLVVRRLLTPTERDLRALDLPEWAEPAYFALRPLLWSARMIRGRS
ncbi:MAG: nucleotidyltransferase family protein [Pseudomonadota bacterium]|nr:nucleotidyltransferase family protein [Pseudomonadota bacterium]